MNHIQHIEKQLRGPTQNADFLARYIGARMPGQRSTGEQSRLIYWGHKVPVHRSVAKAKFPFSHLREEEQWEIWLSVWHGSKIYDVKSVALHWLSEPKRKAFRLKRWRDLAAIAPSIDNWAHSDGLSSLLAEMLDERPQFFSQLKTWNKSKNPWLRRQSLVGIYCYARMRKNPQPAARALPLVKNLLHDPHFYVQRGVGWTLREIDRVDTVKQHAFVRKHVRDVNPIAWFAASELYPVKLRKELVLLRRSKG